MSREPFAFRHPVPVRFKDVDIGGHAHHSHALVYFEEARWAYWAEVVGRPDPREVDYVLARAEVRWHRRIFYPATLDVGVRVSLLGRKHFEMEYEARGAGGEVLVSGTTTQVMYDYAAGASTAIPDDVRDAVEAVDGPFGRGGRRVGETPRDVPLRESGGNR